MIQVPEHKLKLEVPGGADRVLLHTCCAPCSSAIIECMLQQGITPVIYYSNANIFPLEEYLHRKDECTRYAESLGLEVIDDDWVHDEWRCEVARGRENEPERGARCLECFKFRLLRAAKYAAGHGLSVLTTTLASSRWKDLDQVNAAGLWACGAVNASSFREVAPSLANSGSAVQTPAVKTVAWWSQNWRKGGLQDRRNQIIKEMNFYNQQYCGCEYSMRNTEEKR